MRDIFTGLVFALTIQIALLIAVYIITIKEDGNLVFFYVCSIICVIFYPLVTWLGIKKYKRDMNDLEDNSNVSDDYKE